MTVAATIRASECRCAMREEERERGREGERERGREGEREVAVCGSMPNKSRSGHTPEMRQKVVFVNSRWRGLIARPLGPPADAPSAAPAAAQPVAPQRPSSPWQQWSAMKAWHWSHADQSIIRELLAWNEGEREELDPQTKSTLGFDPFLYFLNNKLAPTREQRELLKAVLVHHALNHPEKLLYHIFNENLANLTSARCSWAVFGRVKTLSLTGRPRE